MCAYFLEPILEPILEPTEQLTYLQPVLTHTSNSNSKSMSMSSRYSKNDSRPICRTPQYGLFHIDWTDVKPDGITLPLPGKRDKTSNQTKA